MSALERVNEDSDLIHKAGFLSKIAKRSIFAQKLDRRWFVLRKDSLSYYTAEPEKNGTLRGTISLVDIVRVGPRTRNDEHTQKHGWFGFEVATGNRLYVMYAEDENDGLSWLNAIRHSIFMCTSSPDHDSGHATPADSSRLRIHRVDSAPPSLRCLLDDSLLEGSGSGTSDASPRRPRRPAPVPPTSPLSRPKSLTVTSSSSPASSSGVVDLADTAGRRHRLSLSTSMATSPGGRKTRRQSLRTMTVTLVPRRMTDSDLDRPEIAAPYDHSASVNSSKSDDVEESAWLSRSFSNIVNAIKGKGRKRLDSASPTLDDRVRALLVENGLLDAYGSKMAEEHITLDVILELEPDEWRELGVSLGHRKQLQKGAVMLLSSDGLLVDSMDSSMTRNVSDEQMRRSLTATDMFLSYRRSDGQDLGGRLCAEMENFGLTTFFDRECLPAGDFLNNLREGIRRTRAFVPVITPDYLDEDRMGNPDDYCRREIEMALEMGKPIIPVVQEGFSNCFEIMQTMPPSIRGIAAFDCVSIVNEFFLSGSMQKLYDMVTSLEDDTALIETV